MDIHLDWSGPYSLDEARNGERGQTLGLYQYTGMHDVYGPGTLLYLGMAADRPISCRLQEHVHHEWSCFPVEILIGNVASENVLDSGEQE